MREIKIIIAKDGSVVVDVNGEKGDSCQKLTEGLEESLGSKVRDEKKPEYYQQQEDHQSDYA